MNFFRFVWRTAPQLYFAHAVLAACVVASIAEESFVGVVASYTLWTAVLVITVAGVMRHRHALYVQHARRLVSWSFLNSFKYGYRTPSKEDGLKYLDAADRDPLTEPKIEERSR